MSARLDVAGQRFGRWLALSRDSFRNRSMWTCRCACGQKRSVSLSDLRSGKSVSCGCFKSETARTHFVTHGHASALGNRAPEYRVWSHIKDRCHNPKQARYADYGGRGVVMCSRWRQSYEAFIEDVGRRPSSRHSLDRIDNDGNYAPGNVRWATAFEQAQHTRRTRLLTTNGRTQTLSSWARELGLAPATLTKRLARGWSVDKTLAA